MAGKRDFDFVQAEIVAHDVHEVGGILAVVDGECGSSPRLAAYSRSSRAPMPWKVPAQRSASVTAPGEVPITCAGDALDAPAHLAGGAAREGHQQDAAADRRR